MAAQSKAPWQSATLQGVGVTLLGNIVTLFHLPLGGDEVNAIVSAVLILGGLAYTVYGRLKTNGESISI